VRMSVAQIISAFLIAASVAFTGYFAAAAWNSATDFSSRQTTLPLH
jgi:hypothetical protein